ncbi:MAG: precorrin-2 C(20)-methyltransferase [Oscillospiraceae bacterium]|nr:precorrin-2 C(20)-methyltransferase [Oscillospiraceae bacterium]
MEKACFYGVSVGPGDPALLTVKAIRVMEACPVIAAPQTKGEKTLALDIARQAVSLKEKEILLLPFLMTKDPQLLSQSHQALAGQVAAFLRRGKSVAMLNLGDVSVYSTFSYLSGRIQAAGYPVEWIPGVPSFCAVAAKLQTSLTVMDRPVQIIPAGHGHLQEALALPGTKVLMKTGKAMPQVRQALRQAGLYEKTGLVQNCGLPDEKVCRSLDEADDQPGYFTTMIVGE